MCSADLLAPGTNYLIEKVFRKKETIFEYAMCFDCHEAHRETLSLKSHKLVENYFDEQINLEERQQCMLAEKGHRKRSWLGHSMIKGTPRWKCEEHQIYGWFVDRDIAFNGMPYLLSGQVIDELLELLSPEILGILDKFSDKLFGFVLV